MGKGFGHALHDLFEVTAAVDGGWVPRSAAGCPTCAVLHIDLVALRGAIPTMAIPNRPRDLRLTAADADRLRPSAWRRLVASIGTSRDRLTRPLALSFTGLGLAGLLLGVVPGALPFGGAGADDGAGVAPVDTALHPELQGLRVEPSEVPGSGRQPAAAPSDGDGTLATIESAAPSPLLFLSIGLLGIGGGLFGVRRFAVRSGPVR